MPHYLTQGSQQKQRYDLDPFADLGLSEALLETLFDEHDSRLAPKYARLWRYFRNEAEQAPRRSTTAAGGRSSCSVWRPAQAQGLPSRLLRDDPNVAPKEIVIENDIAWRLLTLVEYTAGRGMRIECRAAAGARRSESNSSQSVNTPDELRRRAIETVVATILESNGGLQFVQDLCLLGGVYGHVDILVRADALLDELANGEASLLNDARLDSDTSRSSDSSNSSSSSSSSPESSARAEPSNPMLAPRDRHQTEPGSKAASTASSPVSASALRAAAMIRLETVEAPRAIPILSPSDYRAIDGYILRYRRARVDAGASALKSQDGAALTTGGLGFAARILRRAHESIAPSSTSRRRRHHEHAIASDIVEIVSASHHQVYDDGRLIIDEPNAFGRIPVVHIQNQSQPYFYEGLGEVEPLIPLQDELNTRLSDRANRVTMQSFRMYLGKGIDGFNDRTVGPGQMWMTDNMEASIEAFGGDASSPSEETHIKEIREAMDRVSAVSPLAAGVIRSKVGTLSSENALRISLLGLLSKVERLRRNYAAGIIRAMKLALHVLDATGVFPTDPSERELDIVWPAPIPESENERLQNALLKRQLGVSAAHVLRELGYDADQIELPHSATHEDQ